MRLVLLLLVIFFSSGSWAKVSGFFPPNMSILLVQGNDSDGSHLWDSLNVEITEGRNFKEKTVHLENEKQEIIFELSCRMTTAGQKMISCHLRLPASPFTTIDPQAKQVHLAMNDAEWLKPLSEMFLHKGAPFEGEVFYSEDQHLRIWKSIDPKSGELNSFHIDYREER